jgi:hypothetical protein
VREQITLVDLQFHDDLDLIRRAVWSCYQENPTAFEGVLLSDPGAFPAAPLSGRITWRVTQPWAEPSDEKERAARDRARQLLERIRRKTRS